MTMIAGLVIAGVSAFLVWWSGAPFWAVVLTVLVMDGIGEIAYRQRYRP